MKLRIGQQIRFWGSFGNSWRSGELVSFGRTWACVSVASGLGETDLYEIGREMIVIPGNEEKAIVAAIKDLELDVVRATSEIDTLEDKIADALGKMLELHSEIKSKKVKKLPK